MHKVIKYRRLFPIRKWIFETGTQADSGRVFFTTRAFARIRLRRNVPVKTGAYRSNH